MSELKAGDRVRLKGFAEVGGETSDVEGSKAEVIAPKNNMGRIRVRVDGANWEVQVYRSQCVPLIKRKPREWWTAVDEAGSVYTLNGVTLFSVRPMGHESLTWIKVREVKSNTHRVASALIARTTLSMDPMFLRSIEPRLSSTCWRARRPLFKG